MKNLVFKLESYFADVNGTDGIWNDLEKALAELSLDAQKKSGFSVIEVWDVASGEYLGEGDYPDIHFNKLNGRFYFNQLISTPTIYGNVPWYFDSAVEYRMKAVGALRDDDRA